MRFFGRRTPETQFSLQSPESPRPAVSPFLGPHIVWNKNVYFPPPIAECSAVSVGEAELCEEQRGVRLGKNCQHTNTHRHRHIHTHGHKDTHMDTLTNMHITIHTRTYKLIWMDAYWQYRYVGLHAYAHT